MPNILGTTLAYLRTKTVGGRKYLYLVSTTKIEGRVRQRHLLYVGRRRPSADEAHVLDIVARYQERARRPFPFQLMRQGLMSPRLVAQLLGGSDGGTLDRAKKASRSLRRKGLLDIEGGHWSLTGWRERLGPKVSLGRLTELRGLTEQGSTTPSLAP